MEKQPQSRVPLIVAIVLLVLPVLYVGCYLVLVVPGSDLTVGSRLPDSPYRIGGQWAECVFWPLEQIDRKVRPNAWLFSGVVVPDSLGSGRQLASP